MATIWDADILIWAATQVTEAMDRGGGPSPDISSTLSSAEGIRRQPAGINTGSS